jgi:hypothetical protein
MPGNSMLEYNQSDHLEPLFSETPMCIFSQAIENVYSTMIFARATAAKTQFLAYQMSYKSGRENAMILPLPIRQPTHAASLRFIDLKHYEDFFDHLATGFPYLRSGFGIGCSAIPNVPKAIEVQRVGNYVASFVPTLADFARLDPRFTLPDETWAKIPAYKDYGFAVFYSSERREKHDAYRPTREHRPQGVGLGAAIAFNRFSCRWRGCARVWDDSSLIFRPRLALHVIVKWEPSL